MAELSSDTWPYSSSSWFSSSFARDNDAMTKALQFSLSDSSSASDSLPSLPPLPPPSPRRVAPAPAPSKKIAKRKSRASNRSPTTYINADPSNFRRMVQEVTGIRIADAPLQFPPDPQRTALLQPALPTLDTSAFGLDRPVCASFGPVDGPAFDFEPFPVFPTLESWGMSPNF